MPLNTVDTLCVSFALALASFAAQAQETALEIRVPQPAGYARPVQIESAELLLAWWGDTAKVALAHRFDGSELVVSVPLDARRWTGVTREDEPDFGFVALAFEDFVPVRSERFYLLGSNAPAPAPTNWQRATEIRFAFRGAEPVVIRPGEQRRVTLAVRGPVPKRLRFVDDTGQPVGDLSVDVGNFWSRSNHCGVASGMQPLLTGARSDAEGVVAVPDGDIEYGIAVSGRHLAILDRDAIAGFFPTYVDGSEEVVRIHRFAREPLTLQVTRAGQPAAGIVVGASAATTQCGVNFGPLGRTDAMGVLQLPEFYPEEYAALCIGSGERPAWASPPPNGGAVTVDLPADTQADSIDSCALR